MLCDISRLRISQYSTQNLATGMHYIPVLALYRGDMQGRGSLVRSSISRASPDEFEQEGSLACPRRAPRISKDRFPGCQRPGFGTMAVPAGIDAGDWYGSAESTFAFIASEPPSPNLPARLVSRGCPTFADFSDNRGDNGCGMSRMMKLEVHASTDEAHLEH